MAAVRLSATTRGVAAGEDGVVWLGRVGDSADESGLQAGGYDRGQGVAQVVLFDDGADIGPGAFVGDGGAAGDNVEGAADDVAEGEGEEGCGRGGAGELAAFDGAGVFAQAVHLVDGCAAGQEGVGHGLHVGQGEGRVRLAGAIGGLACGRDEEGGAAAGEEGDHQVVGGGLLDEGEHLFAGEDASLVGNGMTGLDDADAGGRCGGGVGGLGVVVFGYGEAAADAFAEGGFDGAGHGHGGLSGSDDEDAAVAAQVVGVRGRGLAGGGVGDGQRFVAAPEDVLHGGEGVDGIEGGVEDGEDGAAGGGIGGEDGLVEAGHSCLALVSGRNRLSSWTSW